MPPRRLALLGLALALLLATAMVTVLSDDDPSDPASSGSPSTETVAPGAPGAACELEDSVGIVPDGLWFGPLAGPDGTELGRIGLVVAGGEVTEGTWSLSGEPDDEGPVAGPATGPVLTGFAGDGDATLTIVAFGCESVTATVEVPGPLAGTTVVATWTASPA